MSGDVSLPTTYWRVQDQLFTGAFYTYFGSVYILHTFYRIPYVLLELLVYSVLWVSLSLNVYDLL